MTAKILEDEYTLGPLAESLGFLTRVIQVQTNERLRAAGGMSLSLPAYATLQLLDANPGIRQVNAARILVIQESNMANLIKALMEQELVERREEAGKRGGLWITAKGEAELALCAPLVKLDRAYANVLDNKEYRQLLDLLNRVYRASLPAQTACRSSALTSALATLSSGEGKRK